MLLIYPAFGDDRHDLAKRMIASARKHMDVRVIQETDDKSKLHPEADWHYIKPRKGPLIPWLRSMDSEFDGDCIFCDSDVIFRADISPLFRESFDVAMCRRTNEREDEPWMGGFYLSRNRQFWRDVVSEVEKMKPEDQEWFGSQKAMPKVVHRYRVMELDPLVYSYRPKSVDEQVTAKVLHFRSRKDLMLQREW